MGLRVWPPTDTIRRWLPARLCGRRSCERFKIENGQALGMECGHLLWDMVKLYDPINLLILAEELIKLSYPPELLIIGI